MKLLTQLGGLGPRFWTRLILGICVLGNLFMLTLFVGLDRDIAGVESNVVFTLQNTLEDHALLYSNPEQFPFSITQYSPLYYMLADGLLGALGAEPHQDLYIRVVGRLLSVLFSVILGWLFYNLSRRYFGASRLLSLALVMALIIFTAPWFFFTRPDTLLALSYLLFIILTLRYLDNKGWGNAVGMGVIAVMAIVSKQSGIFLIGVGGLFFLYYRDFKGLFQAFLGFVLALGLFALTFSLLGFEHEFLLDNIFKGVQNGIGIRSFLDHTLLDFLSVFGFYITVSLYLCYDIWKKGMMDKRIGFLVAFGFLLFGFSTLTALKQGSAVNYYHEFLMVSLLIWAAYWSSLSTEVQTKWSGLGTLFIALSALFVTFSHMRTYLFTNLKEYAVEDTALLESRNIIGSELGEDYIYSNVRQVIIAFPGRVAIPQFDIVGCCAFGAGIYDYTEFCRLMEIGKLKFLIFENQAPISLYGCDLEGLYEPYRQYGRYHIYRNTVSASVPGVKEVDSDN